MCPDWSWGSLSFLWNEYQGFPEVKTAELGLATLPLPSAKTEYFDPYIHIPRGASWPIMGIPFTIFSLVSAFSQENKTYKMGLGEWVSECVCVFVCVCVCVCVCLCKIFVPLNNFQNQLSDWYEILATYSIVPELSNATNPVS